MMCFPSIAPKAFGNCHLVWKCRGGSRVSQRRRTTDIFQETKNGFQYECSTKRAMIDNF